MGRLLAILLLPALLAAAAGTTLRAAPEADTPPQRGEAAQLNPWAEPPAPSPQRLEVRRNFYEDGALRTQWQVRVAPDGTAVRHGRLVRYHRSGYPALRGRYRNGRRVGVWRWYDERGRLLRSAVPQDGYDFVLRGRELENPNMVYRDPEGRRIAEGQHKYGKAHGPWIYYHPDGSVSAQGRFVNGLPDGRWVFYFRTGQVQRLEEYRLGVPHGTVLRGWPNGQERLEGRVEHGLRVGRWRTWYENGQVESDGHYREDRREGEWRFWDDRGRLVRHVRYAAGEVVKTLPLPQPDVAAPRIVTEPELLPFRPRIYDEGGSEIRLRQE